MAERLYGFDFQARPGNHRVYDNLGARIEFIHALHWTQEFYRFVRRNGGIANAARHNEPRPGLLTEHCRPAESQQVTQSLRIHWIAGCQQQNRKRFWGWRGKEDIEVDAGSNGLPF